MWAVIGGMIIGIATFMFQESSNWLWFLLLLPGCILIYEARWTHFDWMYPKWMQEL